MTYCGIVISTKDTERALKELSEDDREWVKVTDLEKGETELWWDETRYGGQNICGDLLNAKIDFYGSHGGEGNYDPMEFVGLDGKIYEVLTSDRGYLVIVDVVTGEVDPTELAEIKKFIQVRDTITRRIQRRYRSGD